MINEKEPILKDQDLFSYIPQRPPIVMVDKLYHVGEDMALTGLSIKPDNILVKYGVLSSIGLIEHVAQSVAVLANYQLDPKNLSSYIGFIGAVKNMSIYNWPPVNSDILTEIKIQSVMDVKIVHGVIRQADTELEIGRMELKLFIRESSA